MSFSRQNILNVLFLLVVVLAIPVSVVLLRETQIFRSQAANVPVRFPQGTGVEVINDKAVAVDDDIEIEVSNPFTGTGTSGSTSPTPAGGALSVNGNVTCSSGSQAVFSWPPVDGASSYAVSYKRDIDGQEITGNASTSRSQTIQLNPGPYARWYLTINFADGRPAQKVEFAAGFTCTGSSTQSTNTPTPTSSVQQSVPTNTPVPAQPTATTAPVAGRSLSSPSCQKSGDRVVCSAQPAGSTTRIDVYMTRNSDGADLGSYEILNAGNSWTNSDVWSHGSGSFTPRFIPIDGSGSGPWFTGSAFNF